MTTAEVAEAAGVPRRTLASWCEMGLLRPPGYTGKRRVPTQWPRSLQREARVLAALRRAGFSLQRVRQVLEYLRRLRHNPFSAGRFLVVRGRGGRPEDLIKLCSTGEAFTLLREARRGQMILPLWSPPEEEVVGE